ncbi:HNH endonuclease signature motif containing protein [Leucobacter ruminantium]|uniref:DUF222 domain-containing protein n=1 Tax=Leucobacter ruminantium TaxID=1289170 RepID=A0A939RYD0_9MICO|nr:HNH endonuclease signature motif containing protein [Leucobacter ruminantium]MBO1804741.1 DUF222 domain-containing protein [Leucobacter ruminantium]
MSSIPFAPGTVSHARLQRLAADLEDVEQEQRGLEARKVELLAEVGRLAEQERGLLPSDSRSAEMTHRAAAAEVSFVLGIADRSAERLIERARRLHERYPRVQASLAAGRIALAHAVGIVEAGDILGTTGAQTRAGADAGTASDSEAGEADIRAAYEAEALAVAEVETPNRTRRLSKTIAERHASRTLEQRFERAHAERRVWVTELGDGMAELHAVADAVSVHAAYDRLSRQAHEIQRTDRRAEQAAVESGAPGVPQPRSLDQARADLALDVLLNGSPSNENGAIGLGRIDARVQVIVPAAVLLSTDSRETSGHEGSRHGSSGHRNPGYGAGAAVLAGFGPIDAATARRLAAITTGWDRAMFDTETGELLKVDRYRPSAEIIRFLEVRDQHCRFWGCTVPPFRADRDHTRDAALGGETSTRNLSVLCRRHHMMKHHTGLGMTQLKRGDIEWRSTLGRRVRDRPASRVMFEPTRAAPQAEPTAQGNAAATRGEPDAGLGSGAEPDVGPRTGTELDSCAGLDPGVGLGPRTKLDPGAEIGPGAEVGPGAEIGPGDPEVPEARPRAA